MNHHHQGRTNAYSRVTSRRRARDCREEVGGNVELFGSESPETEVRNAGKDAR